MVRRKSYKQSPE